MNEKQQQLLFDKGITNVPSDALCSDNALEESLGMVYDNGEHRVIQKPVVFMTGAPKILFVHKVNDNEVYITLDGGNIKWGTKNNGAWAEGQSTTECPNPILSNVTGTNIQVTSIGNTLIVTDDTGMHHFKWNGNGYKSLSFPLPELYFSAKLCGDPTMDFVINTGNAEGIFEYDYNLTKHYKIASESQEKYNDLVVGLYSKNLKEVAQQKAFAEPFMVRAAYELYDGSYTYVTNPIPLFPAVTENTGFYLFASQTSKEDYAIKRIIAVTQTLQLFIRRGGSDLSDYSDIIKDVVVFISKGVKIYKTSQDQPFVIGEYEDFTIGNNISSLWDDYTGVGLSEHRITSYKPEDISGLNLFYNVTRCLTNRESKSINDDIEGTSIFYKVASLGLKPINSYENIASRTTAEILESLESQERLENDDYFSRCSIVPKVTYAYNSRLNLANAKRGFFNGFGFFMPLDSNSPSYYTFDVTIKTDSGEVTVRLANDYTEQKQGIYFYYPDSRASHVKIYKGSGPLVAGSSCELILEANLKEHPFLHGAYYFAGVTPETDEQAGTSTSLPDPPPTEYENLYNQIIQSEVNNPWLFLASGYHTVGFSNIVGVSTVTQALSEGQFGAYPLLVFSEEGIWAMSVDGTGLYNAIHPMSREVCNNPKSITQTDGAVFFASKKGLMVVVGNQVKCVSEQLSGRDISFFVDENGTPEEQTFNLGNFVDFLKSAYIAYDYRDSLLWIFNANYDACWVYSIKSGTFGKYDFGAGKKVSNVVNFYPDYLMQNADGVLSLLDRPNINNDKDESDNDITYNTKLITRPMKFENALALKSIMQIRHIKDFTPYTTSETVSEGTVTHNWPKTALRIFASNNMDHWTELCSLRGMPWKYYKFCFDFTGLKATDRFSGSMIVTQERRTNKMR